MRRRTRVLVLSLAILSSPIPALAQPGGGVSALGIFPRHDAMREALQGLAGNLDIPLRDARWTLRLGAQYATGSASGRIGPSCFGLVPPDADCTPDRYHDDTRFASLSFGALSRLYASPRIALALTGDLRLAALRIASVGQRVGRLGPDHRLAWGGDIGAEAAWYPSSRTPTAILLGVATGGLIPIALEECADCNPGLLTSAFGLSSVRLGLAWRPMR